MSLQILSGLAKKVVSQAEGACGQVCSWVTVVLVYDYDKIEKR